MAERLEHGEGAAVADTGDRTIREGSVEPAGVGGAEAVRPLAAAALVILEGLVLAVTQRVVPVAAVAEVVAPGVAGPVSGLIAQVRQADLFLAYHESVARSVRELGNGDRRLL